MMGKDIKKDLADFTEYHLNHYNAMKKLKSSSKAVLSSLKDFGIEMVKSCALNGIKPTKKGHPKLSTEINKATIQREVKAMQKAAKAAEKAKAVKPKPVAKAEAKAEASKPATAKPVAKPVVKKSAHVGAAKVRVFGTCPICVSDLSNNEVASVDENHVECPICKTNIEIRNGQTVRQK